MQKQRSLIRRTATIAAILAVSLLVIFVALVAFNLELRNFLLYKLAPKYARNRNFHQVQKSGAATVYLLGTIHGSHLESQDFSLGHLTALITNLKPDLLLVESRPQFTARRRFGDGPIEMPVAALHAVSLGIAVEGVDWWLPTSAARRTDDSRDDKIYSLIRAALSRHKSAKRVLILLGFSHVPEMLQRFSSDGFRESRFGDERKDLLFRLPATAFKFPPGTRDAINQRIAELKVQLTASFNDHKWRRILQKTLVSRQQFLRRIDAIGEHRPLKK